MVVLWFVIINSIPLYYHYAILVYHFLGGIYHNALFLYTMTIVLSSPTKMCKNKTPFWVLQYKLSITMGITLH